MYRAAAVFFLLAAPGVFAQAKPGDPIKIAVSPAAAPKPSLKYRLIPDRRDLAPGNAATLYYRSMAFFVENSELLKEIRQEYWSEWLDTPPKDLPMEQVREKLGMARRLLHEVELGARCKDCDWQIEDRPEGIGLLLPEVQSFRNVAVVLAVKARYEIAQGKWDEACETLQTGYAVGRHMGQGPTLIHVLDGGVITRLMNDQVQTMIQQPGAPNLYWALTDLPHPFLDPELAVEQDSRMIDRMIPWVKRLDGPPMSEAEAQAAMDEMRKGIDHFAGDYSLVKPSELDKATQAFFLLQVHGEAKRGLLARDKYAAEQVEAMPQFQVVGLYTYLEYREALDEMLKWVHAPNGLRHPGFQKASEKYATCADPAGPRVLPRRAGQRNNDRRRRRRVRPQGVRRRRPHRPADRRPGMRRGAADVRRRERQMAGLEAISKPLLRGFACENPKESRCTSAPTGGFETTSKLDDVTDVPLPDDPMTGKPFEYHVQDTKAAIAAPPITAGKSDGPDGVTIEAYLRK